MKKLVLTVAAGLFVLPVLAADNPVQAPATEQVQSADRPGDEASRHEAFQKAHKEQMEKMKATREKAEKLVKEYNGLKAGKKKDAKKKEIVELVASIHEEQLLFKEKQLASFEERLNLMKKGFQEESAPEAKQLWADQKAAELIENNGDVKVVFGPAKQGPGMKGPDGKRGPKGFKGGKKGPRGFGGMKKGQLPPPPPPVDEN